MKRIEFLKKRWVENDKFVNAGRRDFSTELTGVSLFNLLLKGDPTPKHLYSDFVLRCYSNGEFLCEDIERIKETLSHFHNNKRRLSAERRDIGAYTSERDIWTVLTEAGLLTDETLSGKQAKRSDRNRAHLESEVVIADGWTMARLGSAFAATWWGMGTRWCTTEKSGNIYKNYADRGPLRVFVSPEGVKHQLHVATSSLCDAMDRRVSIEEFLRTVPSAFIPEIRSDVTSYCDQYCDRLTLPNAEPERQFRYLYNAILQLPLEFFSEEMTTTFDRLRKIGLERLRVVEECDGWVLKTTTSDFSSWALHREMTLPFDDRRYTTVLLVESPDNQKFAVDFDVLSMEPLISVVPDMPPQLREKLLAWGVKNWHRDREQGVELYNLIASAPPGEFSSTFWKGWAKRLGGHDVDCMRQDRPEDRFGAVPTEVMTAEIALVFAKQGMRDRIPDHFITRDVARTLAKADPASRVDPEITSLFTLDDYADVYGGNNGRNLGGLPTKFKTYDMAKRIVRKRRGALPELLKMVRNGDFDLEGQPLDNVVEEICHGAIDESAASLVDIDIPLSRETYLEAVKKDAGMMSWVPLEYRDVELCSASIAHSAHGLCHFPEWVVKEIRDANDGGHGITHNYKPSVKYAAALRSLVKPEGDIPQALPPFSVQAFVEAAARS